jgi:hypothetical protein
VYFFIFETRGRTLENVNELFDKNNVLEDTLDSGEENTSGRGSAEKDTAVVTGVNGDAPSADGEKTD